MTSLVRRPTFAEINLANLEFNVDSVRGFIGADVACMAVVKANAYGHGAIESAQKLEHCGVEWLGVALPEEGIELRKAGIDLPILCLSGFWEGQEKLLLEYDLTPVVFDLERAIALNKAAVGVKKNVHVKIDTGMGRVGVPYLRSAEFARSIAELENIRVEGLMTHFATADDLQETDFTNEQMSRFRVVVEEFGAAGITPEITDLANSPAAVAHPDSRSRLVRLGGVIYGLGDDVLPKGIDKPELKPVMSVFSEISRICEVAENTSLGYGRTFTTKKDSLIATVPIGYHDGFSRGLSNKGTVLVSGSVAPVVGRVSMDWIIVDVTEIESVRVGDRVTIIGEDGDHSIKASDLARITGTISYEITCGIDARVERRYVDGA